MTCQPTPKVKRAAHDGPGKFISGQREMAASNHPDNCLLIILLSKSKMFNWLL
jgi:hypothetical protein